MVVLAKTLTQASDVKILVIGDFLLDTYTMGKAKRISPEAPVVVLKVEEEEQRPGGAGNVVLNLVSLGAKVVAVGRLGSDSSGDLLKESLAEEGVDVRGLLVQKEYPTPVKKRVIANHQQIIRIDRETVAPLSTDLEEEVEALLPELLKDVDVIAISDYGKGFLTSQLLQSVIKEGKTRNIPTIADPKGIDFSKYFGVTILKPNLGETFAAANLLPEDNLDEAASRLLEKTQTQVLMVTRSEAGISLFFQNKERADFPVKVREVVDVTGAGDTVLAVLSWALANELSVEEATELSNVAAGIAIERFGCARVTLGDLAMNVLERDVKNSVFDEEHLYALVEALRDRPYTLLTLDQSRFTAKIFQSIRDLRDQTDALIVFIRDKNPCKELVSILTSLDEVDFLILKPENLNFLRGQLRPEKSYLLEGENSLQLEKADCALEGAR